MSAESTNIVGGPKRHPSGPGPEIMAAETLEGNDVYNPAGEKLGTVETIMIDVPRGRIAYAVLARGGVMGVGDKLYAIPWAALTLDTDRKCFVLDVPKDQLKQAEGFDKHNWPRMADERWASDVHAYYNQRPYW
ncbi:PRC-barrel domain-containing protein [Bordetella genomosp. 5]|uniref:Photosystem reaction center subunit H n=1 Tax=Bordetella genomosp. 5 TaxID=1395608 RepID=A0A261TQ44_9BORD|nr:PRC-barrel domain-containing protein [Bordetella genomosp. 5]OZI51774.1 photosystem reaction center subunit H [Bordetella genomosp. 5]